MGKIVDLNDEISLTKEREELIKEKSSSLKNKIKRICGESDDPNEISVMTDSFIIDLLSALIVRVNEIEEGLESLTEDLV